LRKRPTPNLIRMSASSTSTPSIPIKATMDSATRLTTGSRSPGGACGCVETR
jgi:hypothetical protein